jgi:hypothetical protein
MDNLLGFLGGAAGFALGGLPGATLGASIGGGLDANKAREEAAQSANEFSASQYASRYQTQAKDMQAAGLNPMLAYMQAPGSSPTGQSYQPSNAFERASSDYASAANVERQGQQIEANTAVQRAEMWLKDAQTSLAGASAEQSRAATGKLEVESKKIVEEIKNVPLEGDRLIALVKNLASSTTLINAQSNTEAQRAIQMKWLALKTMVEGDLLTLDREAITKFENFGKESSQFKPLVEMILSLSRVLRR